MRLKGEKEGREIDNDFDGSPDANNYIYIRALATFFIC